MCCTLYMWAVIAAAYTAVESIGFLIINLLLVLVYCCVFDDFSDTFRRVESWYFYVEGRCPELTSSVLVADKPPFANHTDEFFYAGISPSASVTYQAVYIVLHGLWIASSVVIFTRQCRKGRSFTDYVMWLVVAVAILIMDTITGIFYSMPFTVPLDYDEAIGGLQFRAMFLMVCLSFRYFIFYVINIAAFIVVCTAAVTSRREALAAGSQDEKNTDNLPLQKLQQPQKTQQAQQPSGSPTSTNTSMKPLVQQHARVPSYSGTTTAATDERMHEQPQQQQQQQQKLVHEQHQPQVHRNPSYDPPPDVTPLRQSYYNRGWEPDYQRTKSPSRGTRLSQGEEYTASLGSHQPAVKRRSSALKKAPSRPPDPQADYAEDPVSKSPPAPNELRPFSYINPGFRPADHLDLVAMKKNQADIMRTLEADASSARSEEEKRQHRRESSHDHSPVVHKRHSGDSSSEVKLSEGSRQQSLTSGLGLRRSEPTVTHGPYGDEYQVPSKSPQQRPPVPRKPSHLLTNRASMDHSAASAPTAPGVDYGKVLPQYSGHHPDEVFIAEL